MIGIALFMVACGKPLTPEMLLKVEKGMTPEQVAEILGHPQRREQPEMPGLDTHVDVWQQGGTEIKVVFLNGQVADTKAVFE